MTAEEGQLTTPGSRFARVYAVGEAVLVMYRSRFSGQDSVAAAGVVRHVYTNEDGTIDYLIGLTRTFVVRCDDGTFSVLYPTGAERLHQWEVWDIEAPVQP